MARASIFPDLTKTIHILGDMHVGPTFVSGHITQPRVDKVFGDLVSGMVPTPVMHMQIGDLVDDGGGGGNGEDQACQALLALLTDAPVRVIPGNHDTNGIRTTAAWATSFATYLEGGVYPWTKDLGFVRLIAVGDLDPGTQAGDPAAGRPYLPQSHLDYLAAQAAAANGQKCWVMSHAPLYNTVLGKTTGDNPQWISTEPFFFAHAPLSTSADSSSILAVLAANPNIEAWFCGHTHSSIHAPGFFSTLSIGGRSFAHINVSAVYYVGRTNEQLTDPIRSIYATKVTGGIELRIRDHGNAAWAGLNGSRVTTMVVT